MDKGCSETSRLLSNDPSPAYGSPFGAMKGIASLVSNIEEVQVIRDYPILVVYMVAIAFSGASITGWYAFLVPSGIQKGLSMDMEVWLATTGGEHGSLLS